MNSLQTIEDTLNIENYDYLEKNSDKIVSTVESNVETVKDNLENEQLNDDFERARKNILKMIEDIKDDIRSLKLLADASEDPRAWQAWNGTLKILMDLNNNLVSLYERKNKAINTPKEEKKNDSEEKPAQVTNHNTLFVGSGKDLNKFIKDLKSGEITTDDFTQSSE